MSDTTIDGPEGHSVAAQLEGVLPEELYAAGGQFLRARDYSSARACLEKYLEHRPDDPAALHLLARVLFHQNKDFDKAEEYLNRAASLDPDSITSYLETLGTLLIRRANYVRAQEVFEYALSQDRQKNERHTAILKYYLELAKKKGGEKRPFVPKSYGPRSLFFTAQYGHTVVKARFFVLPSIVVHALVLLLMMYLSIHSLPFRKNIAPFTIVELQPAGEIPPPEEARREMPREAASGGQATAAQPSRAGAGLNPAAVTANVGPQAQPKVAGVQRGDLTAPAAPEIKEAQGGRMGALGAKAGAGLTMKPGDIVAVSAMPGTRKLDIEGVRPALSGGDVKLPEKSLMALAGGAEAAPGKHYQTAKLGYKAPAPAGGAGGTAGMSAAPGGGPVWERERLAKLSAQELGAASDKPAAEKNFPLTNPALKPALPDEVKSFPARPLNIGMGASGQGAKSEKNPGLKSLTDMGSDIPAYDMMQENLGTPMPPSGAGKMPVLSKARARLGSEAVKEEPRAERAAAPMNFPADRRFAKLMASPGKMALQMPERRAVTSSAPVAGGAGAARLDEKSSTAPAGYAHPGTAPQGPARGYSGIAKATSPKAPGAARSESALGGLIESAEKKMAGALGLAQPASPSGPPAADMRRGGVAGIQPGARPGAGSAVTGSNAAGRERFDAAPAQPPLASAKEPGGGKLFAGRLPAVPEENSYVSPAGSEAAPMPSGISPATARGAVFAKNAVGLQVRISSPDALKTDRMSQIITGNVSDARVKKVTLTVNSDSRVISVENGAFEASVSLSKGKNVIRVLAFDMDGNVANDSVQRVYSDPPESIPVSISSPSDGQVFDVSEKSVITVKGTIGDQQVKRAKLIFNGNPMDIAVDKGHFEQQVALEQPRNTIVVEATNSSGTSHSQTINFSTVNAKPKDIMAVLSWDKPHADLDLHVCSPSGMDVCPKNPNTHDPKDAMSGGQLEQDAKGNYGPEVFDQRYAEHGIYTVKSNYHNSGGGSAYSKVTIILYGDNPSRRIVRVFGPHLQKATKDGSDTWEVTKIRMPEGIFLEE
jgi:hypothetical protein